MGCDIHLFAEVKIAGKWHVYSHPEIDRNYELFGFMAGVRDHDITPIAAPRGIPEDAAEVTRLAFKSDDGHTPSWLAGAELEAVCKFYEAQQRREVSWCSAELDQFGFLFGNGWTLDSGGSHPKEVEDVRWVFWFDS